MNACIYMQKCKLIIEHIDICVYTCIYVFALFCIYMSIHDIGCGHCKAAKPGYDAAAGTLKSEGNKGIVAAIDATIHTKTANAYPDVTGYPYVITFIIHAYIHVDIQVNMI